MSAKSQETASCTEVGEFSWNELITQNPAASGAFYEKLFGWRSEPFSPEYSLFKKAAESVGGMLKMQGAQPGWLAYVTVEDCDQSARKARELGAKIAVEAKDIPEVGRIAVIVDPQGAALGLFQPAQK